MAVEQVVNSGLKLKTVESIPAKWRIHQVDELFSFLKTNSLSRNDLSYDYPEFPIYNIHYGDIHATFDSSVLDFEKESRVPVIKSMNHLPKEVDYLSEGDLIMADASEDYDGVGEAIEILNLKGRQVLAGLHTIALRGDHRTALGFRSYIFKHPGVVKSLRVIATGTKVYGISKSNVSKLRVILPPLTEQRKIAEILSTWDVAIAQTKALIEQLKLRNKGLAQQLLTGKKRLKGFSGEWKEVKLGDVFEEIKEKNDGGPHEPLTISAKLGFVSQREKFDRIIAGGSLEKYTLIKRGEFSYNKGNSKTYPMGCIFLLEDYESAVIPFVYISFRAKQNISNGFYKNWFANHGLDRQLKAIITSGARGDGLLNVNKKDFFSLMIPMLNLEEQKAISTILRNAEQELKINQDKLESLILQKQGLMQKLLTGEVRVNINCQE